MKKKINCVLLVDDDDATNYIHQYIMKEIQFADHIKIAKNGHKALDYIKSINNKDYLKPDILFLDVNMPVMNGWEFLKQYELLDNSLQNDTMVVLFTTSLKPNEEELVGSFCSIDHVMSKPLTPEMLEKLQVQYFNS